MQITVTFESIWDKKIVSKWDKTKTYHQKKVIAENGL